MSPPNLAVRKSIEAAKQETRTLGKFADMLGSASQSSFMERGSQLLTSLLGARDQSALASAIGQFAGLGQGKSGSLLGDARSHCWAQSPNSKAPVVWTRAVSLIFC